MRSLKSSLRAQCPSTSFWHSAGGTVNSAELRYPQHHCACKLFALWLRVWACRPVGHPVLARWRVLVNRLGRISDGIASSTFPKSSCVELSQADRGRCIRSDHGAKPGLPCDHGPQSGSEDRTPAGDFLIDEALNGIGPRRKSPASVRAGSGESENDCAFRCRDAARRSHDRARGTPDIAQAGGKRRGSGRGPRYGQGRGRARNAGWSCRAHRRC